MTRTTSDLSTCTADIRASTSTTSNSSSSSASFPFTNIFKWKRTFSNASSRNTPGVQSPPLTELEGSSRVSSYFSSDHKRPSRGNLETLGIAIEYHKSDFNSVLEEQLHEERRMRHLAEDRLTEVEEEVTRLCTISLPTDAGETGDAYFSTIISSVRLAIDSYEERTELLERTLEDKTTQLSAERRERTVVDVECRELKSRLKHLEAQLCEALQSSDLQVKNESLTRENDRLRKELELLKSRDSSDSNSRCSSDSRDMSSTVDDFSGDDRAALLQRVKDTEAQRDALRQVSRGLRQRLTIETRKNVDKMRALAAIDVNSCARQARSHSRQDSNTSVSDYGGGGGGGTSVGIAAGGKRHLVRQASLSSICKSLQVGSHASRPRPERYVTASDTLQC